MQSLGFSLIFTSVAADPIHDRWSARDGLDLYNVPLWGAGFFDANAEGNLLVRPHRAKGPGVDLKELVEDLKDRGHQLPLLLRFTDILRGRVREITECFGKACTEYEYDGKYRGVYPIKVNQQAQVVADLLAVGREFGLGLEVGSKPEMLVALAVHDAPDALIICNGYKDRAYVETAMLAQKLGRHPVLVIDRFRDLEVILQVAREHGYRPQLGVRAKLQARGAGRWAESGGMKSKFGLSTSEIMRAVAMLQKEGMLDCLELLHFHIGSQVPAIRVIKDALKEAARIYVELRKLGAPMSFFDVGGGLAVDYDGSNTNFHSSMNYSVQEYANDVVDSIAQECEKHGLAGPTIVTESGRALVAHHAVLVFDVLDTGARRVTRLPEKDEDDHEVVQQLRETYDSIKVRNLLEPYHDAISHRDSANQLFSLGYLDLRGRAKAEDLFYACCSRIDSSLKKLPRVPEELEGLDRALADTYYCNFSVFQSMPDSWAVGQLFPVMPIHRLNERPTRHATLVDLTCDSDGKLDKFIDIHDVKNVIELHSPDSRPYYLGAFLVGAYQEILGDLHNLFGDTNAIHVSLVGDRFRVDHVQRGDTVSEVLNYVEFDRRELLNKVRRACEQALWDDRMTSAESALLLRRYEEALDSYTYLVDDSSASKRRAPTTRPATTRAPASEATPHTGN